MEINQFIAEFTSECPWVQAHTSGSTGAPKPLRLPKSDMRLSARASNLFFGIGADSHVASPLSPDYIAGKMMCVRALEAGCRFTQLEVSSAIVLPPDTAAIDLISVVPAQIPSLIEMPELNTRIRKVLVGGAPASQQALEALCAKGVEVWVSYGMTETCSHVALARGDDPMLIFRAMPGIEFSADASGRLIILAPDYSFGTLITNDVVEIIDGSSFRWLGRADNIINSGGLKLVPEQLENEFANILPAETVFYVGARPSTKWGSELVLFVEGDDATGRHMLELLDASVSDRRHLPKHVEAIKNFPRTSSGKIIRNSLNR